MHGVDETRPVHTPQAQLKDDDPESQNTCVNTALSPAEDADPSRCTTGQAVRGHHVDSKSGNGDNHSVMVPRPLGNQFAMSPCSHRPRRWPYQPDVGVGKSAHIQTPLTMPENADNNSPNSSRDSDWEDPQYFARVKCGNDPTMFSGFQRFHCRPQHADNVFDQIQHMYTMPDAVDPFSQHGMVNTCGPQMDDLTAHFSRSVHVGSNDGDWEDPQYFAMVPSGNATVMFSYSQCPHRWMQQADVGVEEIMMMPSARTPVALPQVADPDSSNSYVNTCASQIEDLGHSLGGPGYEACGWEDPQYPAIAFGDAFVTSHSPPWSQRAGFDETQQIRTDPLPTREPEPPDSPAPSEPDSHPCADLSAKPARTSKKRLARPSSTPPLRSNACKETLYGCGLRVRNTFLEWQEPALFSL